MITYCRCDSAIRYNQSHSHSTKASTCTVEDGMKAMPFKESKNTPGRVIGPSLQQRCAGMTFTVLIPSHSHKVIPIPMIAPYCNSHVSRYHHLQFPFPYVLFWNNKSLEMYSKLLRQIQYKHYHVLSPSCHISVFSTSTLFSHSH